MSFDPACSFLLDMPLDNLYEEIGRQDSPRYRCKGCGAEMAKRERQQHKARHIAGRTRSRNAAASNRQARLEEQLARAREMRKRLNEGS